MKNYFTLDSCLLLAILAAMAFVPELGFAQYGGGGFESKMSGLTSKLLTVVLPFSSILGIIYAVILAMNGESGAKGRIITVVGCSIVGFIAPQIIRFFQAASGN